MRIWSRFHRLFRSARPGGSGVRRVWRRGSEFGRGCLVVGSLGLKSSVVGSAVFRPFALVLEWRSRVLVLSLGLVPRLALGCGDDALPGRLFVFENSFEFPES